MIFSRIRFIVIYWQWNILQNDYMILILYVMLLYIVMIWICKANSRYLCCGSYCFDFLIKCVIFFLHIPTMEYFYLSRKCYKISFLNFILEKIWYMIESGTEITTHILYQSFDALIYPISTWEVFPFMEECYKLPLVDESLFLDVLSFCQLQDSVDKKNHFS